jgi:hypothetical protein
MQIIPGRPYTSFGVPVAQDSLDMGYFAPIFPAPVRDNRSFDFSAMIGDPTATINTVDWTCDNADLNATVTDPNPAGRLIGSPTLTGQVSTQLIGDCVVDVDYLFTGTANLADGRILVKRALMSCIEFTTGDVPIQTLPNGAIIFDYAHWLSVYPEFKSTTEEQANGYWQNACYILRNDGSSPVDDPEQRRMLLELLTAHIAALFGGPGGGPGYGVQMGGVYTSKSVNGVSLGSSGPFSVTGTQQWYMLTRYGQEYWFKTRALRQFQYIPGPQRFPNQYWPYYPYG